MINQVSNSTNRNVFAPLQSNSALYAISKPITDTQKQELEKSKAKKGHNYGVKIVFGALAAGFGVLLLTKGMPKGAKAQLNKIIKSLEDKTTNLKQNNNRTGLQGLRYQALRVAKKLTQYSQAAFNFAPLKDSPFKVLSDKIPAMKKVWNKISEVFEKISVNTSKSAYNSTEKHFNNLYEEFNTINSKLSPEKAEGLKKQVKAIKKSYFNAFSIEKRSERLTQAKIDMGDIHVKHWDRTMHHPFQMVKDKKFYTTFISEELAAPAKINLNNNVSKLKSAITYRVNDDYTSVKKLLNTVDLALDPTNPESRKVIKDLKTSLENYKKIGDEASKKSVIENLSNLNKHVSGIENLDKGISTSILEKINILSTSNEGEIQKIMKEYKVLVGNGTISEQDYAKLEKKANKALKSLDYSVDLETDKLFDKIRDIQIGSAPMDLLGILGSFGVVGWWLGKADNKDERISAALKYGIPAIGAVAISTYCTIGLVSGGPALIVGLVAGKAINILGSFIDKKRKQYKEKPPTLADAAQILPNIKKSLEAPSS